MPPDLYLKMLIQAKHLTILIVKMHFGKHVKIAECLKSVSSFSWGAERCCISTWFAALCGPLQTITLAYLRFLIIARMEDCGSTLDCSFSVFLWYITRLYFFVGFCWFVVFVLLL